MVKKILLPLFFCFPLLSCYAQFFIINGKVTNSLIEPIANVNIKVQGTIFGATTDANGNYKLKLEKGNYEVVFTHIGFHTVKKNITISQNLSLNTIMEEDINAVKEVELNLKRTDRSREIVHEVIRNKEKYVDIAYSCNMYIKAVQEMEEAKKKHKKDSAEKAQKQFVKDSIQKEEEKDKSKSEAPVVYKVQITSSDKPIPLNSDKLHKRY